MLDAGEPGMGASAVSFAWINGRDKDPRGYHDLNRRSIDMWDRFVRRLGAELAVTWGGEFRWVATEEGAAELNARVKELQSWGYPIRSVSPGEAELMEPGLSIGPISAASYTDIDGHAETGAVIAACITKATELGAMVRSNTAVSGFSMLQPGQDGRQIDAVVTDQGEIACDVVVLAGGADMRELAAKAGIDLPMHHTFGATVITEPVDAIFKSSAVVHTPRDVPHPMLNLRQFRDGSVMVHGGTHDGSMGESEGDFDRILQTAIRFVPSLEGVQIKEVRQGRRPMPDDGHPILGFARAVPNLYLAGTHSGVSLAALIGEFATMEIVDGARIDILEPYRVERFD